MSLPRPFPVVRVFLVVTLCCGAVFGRAPREVAAQITDSTERSRGIERVRAGAEAISRTLPGHVTAEEIVEAVRHYSVSAEFIPVVPKIPVLYVRAAGHGAAAVINIPPAAIPMPPTATNPLPLWLRVDSLVLFKSQRRLTIYFANQPIRSYRVALGGSPVGPKHVQRDGRTPEGVYVIDGHNVKSQYHRSLHVSYPNAHDLAWAGAVGKNAGGDVMIHGVPDYAAGSGLLHAVYDWTSGCAAVTDEEIEELFRVVRDGTPIRMLP